MFLAMMLKTSRVLANNLKNLLGWNTRKKLILFVVDDYGTVRLHSKAAREQLDQAGLPMDSRFDTYDTLETREDLQALYEVLNSVKDQNGKGAVFTPYALSCNINFERLSQDGYLSGYHYEHLPTTYKKLSALQPSAYEGTWELWREGIAKGLIAPQFHGREHLNLKVFEEKLQRRDHDIMTALKNRSYTSIQQTDYPSIGWTSAFSFAQAEELKRFPEVIKSGLDAFATVFGYRATAFTPPAQQFHPSLHAVLWENGVQAIDRPLTYKQHLGDGQYKRVVSQTHCNKKTEKVTLVRNVVFEPTEERGVDWVAFTLKQIEAAFRWHKPAIISSHRVNFCGHIDPDNRKKGLSALHGLLQKIVSRWPDVEFISVAELVKLMQEDKGVHSI
ncbi:hypothetical protein [Phaeodactylibacter sp.]|uniref:hypothetical protein n=1 Tax=Phaeodactylibacter sp. TaxID=1940289 RepID=UPI0025FB7B1E|nr:hypothetical protein [Phaeodactylibacter sp.]MCI5056679.1 hypothetical protein [Flavobacteriales bacterium]MCI5090799.1 hypothetical protein [Phaeodactylibacter sp.]